MIQAYTKNFCQIECSYHNYASTRATTCQNCENLHSFSFFPSLLQSVIIRVRRLATLRRWHRATSGPWEWESGRQKPVLQTRPRASKLPLHYLLLSRLNLALPLHTNQEIITISLMMIKISISDHVIFDRYTLTPVASL